MKKITFILLVLLWISDSVAQNSKIVFSCSVSYLPSSGCRYEYYIQNGHKVKHKYEKESTNCWELKFNRGRKINSIPLNDISVFIQHIKKNDTLKLYLSEEIKDSLPNKLLINSNYVKDDSLILIFSKFETEFYKPDNGFYIDSTYIILPKFMEGIQIDGNWLSANFIQNQDTLLSVHKSYSGKPRISDFKEWLTFYLVCHKYKLFQDLQITPYISDENYLYLLRLYLETMKN